MPLNSVQLFVKNLLNGLPLPYTDQNLTAYIAPPTPGDGMQIAVYIWGATGMERRESMPRAMPGLPPTGGLKQVTWQINCWLYWFGPSTDPQADSLFPSVIDAVMQQVRNATQLVATITDPITGQVSTLANFGEDINVDYAPVHSVADERFLAYSARIIIPTKEWFNW